MSRVVRTVGSGDGLSPARAAARSGSDEELDVGEVTDLEEWRQRRAVLDAADRVEAMARSLGGPGGDSAGSSTDDDADEADQPF